MNKNIISPEKILSNAQALRWEVGADFHEKLMESIYTNAAQIADRAVTRPDENPVLISIVPLIKYSPAGYGASRS